MEFDFSQNQTVAALDAVPEDFRGLYKAKADGGFALDSDSPGVKSAVAAVTRLNVALKASRAEAKEHKAKAVDLAPLQAYGKTPDEIAATVSAKLEELQAQAAGSKDAKLNLDKIKADFAAAHAVEKAAMEKRAEALKGQLYGHLVESQALAALAGKAKRPELVLPFIKNQVQTVEEDGAFKVFVVDKASDRRFSGATGSAMTINELVKEMAASETYGVLFNSETPSGGGKAPGSSRIPAAHATQERTSLDKIKAGLSRRR